MLLPDLIGTYVWNALHTDLLCLEQSYFRVWVAEADGDIVGMVAMTVDGELKRLAVDPTCKSRGIGQMLVSRVEQCARKKRLPRVFLTTGSFMPRATRFYHRIGYLFDGIFLVPNFLRGNGAPESVCICKFHRDL